LYTDWPVKAAATVLMKRNTRMVGYIIYYLVCWKSKEPTMSQGVNVSCLCSSLHSYSSYVPFFLSLFEGHTKLLLLPSTLPHHLFMFLFLFIQSQNGIHHLLLLEMQISSLQVSYLRKTTEVELYSRFINCYKQFLSKEEKKP
jgi:hypothetical protein